MTPSKITILGSTGSIGQSTLDVIKRHPDLYSVYALTGGVNATQMIADAKAFTPERVVMATPEAAKTVADALGKMTVVDYGVESMCEVSSHSSVDMVMAAIVGAAGVRPSLAAASAGKRVLLANKESLVVTGHLFMDAVKAGGAEVLPIDSEHNAIFQCLPSGQFAEEHGVRKILLTGSGGPFRERSLDTFNQISVAEAVAHPNWSMGRKISVDSATMMNKGLEFIEACWLFDVRPEQIEVVIHPESVVHSMVQYVDGSVIAQMGNPDMRTPISYGMAWPNRIDAGVPDLSFKDLLSLNFNAPDFARFPCLKLAMDAMTTGGTAPAILNAANEIAVASFLAESIRFDQISVVNERVLETLTSAKVVSVEQVLECDREARALATQIITKECH